MKRVVPFVVLVLAALVCGYMCLAGFEYPGVTTWKLVTGGLAAAFVVGAGAVAVWPRTARN